MHLEEQLVCALRLLEALRDILLEEVDLWEVLFDPSEEVKDHLVDFCGLASRENGTTKRHLESLGVLKESLSKGCFEALGGCGRDRVDEPQEVGE